jgi:hypothetical protein
MASPAALSKQRANILLEKFAGVGLASDVANEESSQDNAQRADEQQPFRHAFPYPRQLPFFVYKTQRILSHGVVANEPPSVIQNLIEVERAAN